jgi:hypothetical protein
VPYKRARRERETDEYMDMVARLIKRAGVRAGEGDEPELQALLALQGVLDDAVATAVAGQRSVGRSWAHIASATGTTRQAAQQRWGK